MIQFLPNILLDTFFLFQMIYFYSTFGDKEKTILSILFTP